jgi:hypothetical protein
MRGVAVSCGSVTKLWLDLCRNIGTVPTVVGGGIKLAVDLLAAEELGTANPVPERISSVGLTSRPYVGCESEALTAKVPLGRPNSWFAKFRDGTAGYAGACIGTGQARLGAVLTAVGLEALALLAIGLGIETRRDANGFSEFDIGETCGALPTIPIAADSVPKTVD